mmetsp:Transcript_73304/g.202279  ORF Transcript_73304/g.202279 Transcript_73304/m.202279 type:complete len:145 (+) Transcript_73304:3-437(+)
MALHIAASQEWRALAPSLVPPSELMEYGLQGIECAQYGAYYAFLRPLRLPFAQMRPMLPVVCVAWGEHAKGALLSLPCPPDNRGRQSQPQAQASSQAASPQRRSRGRSWASKQVSKLRPGWPRPVRESGTGASGSGTCTANTAV